MCRSNLAYLDLGGTVVELISYEGASVDPAPQNEHLGYRMILLEVDDMQKTADYLKTKGVDIVWGPRVRETYSRAEICDLNGYRIELRQRWSPVIRYGIPFMTTSAALLRGLPISCPRLGGDVR